MATKAIQQVDAASAESLADSILDELMTADDVAAILRMRVSTIEDYARRGVLPSIKVGRHRRFLRSQIARAISDLAESWN